MPNIPLKVKKGHKLKLKTPILRTLISNERYVKGWQQNVAANDPLMIGYLFNAYKGSNINNTTLVDVLGKESVDAIYGKTNGSVISKSIYFTGGNEVMHTNFLLSALPKYTKMRTKKIGAGIYFDIETTGLNTDSINNVFGITELGYTLHDFKTNTKQNYGILIGLTDEERNLYLKKLQEIEKNGIQSAEDEIFIQRMAMYSKVKTKKVNIDGLDIIAIESAEKIPDIMHPSEYVRMAREGIEFLSSDELKSQTFTSEKTKRFFEQFVAKLSDKNNIGIGHNIYEYDIPTLNFAFMKAGYGFNIDFDNALDTMQVFRIAYQGNHERLLKTVAQGKELPINLMANVFRLETLSDIFNLGEESSPFHFAATDTLALSNIMDVIAGDNVNKGELKYINEQFQSKLNNELIKYEINKDQMLFFTKGVSLGNTGVMQIKTQNGYEINPYGYINRKGIYTVAGFKSMTKKDILEYVSKNLDGKQAEVVTQALNNGAINDKFYVSVLKDLRDNIIIKVHKSAAEVEKFYQNAIPYNIGITNGLLKAGKEVFQPHKIVQLNELDYAARRFRRFLDIGDTSATLSQLKGIYEVIKKVKDYENSTNIVKYNGNVPTKEYISLRSNIAKLFLHKQDLDGLKYSEIEEILNKYYNGNVTYSLLRDINALYDPLKYEADDILDIIENINSKLPVKGATEYDNIPQLMLRKSAFKKIYDIKKQKLSQAGISTSMEFNKFNYESDVVAIPKDVFAGAIKNINITSDNIDDMYYYVPKSNFAKEMSNIIDSMKDSLGITDKNQANIFAQRRVNELIKFLYENNAIDETIYKRLVSDTIGPYYKLTELQKHIKPEVLEKQSFNLEITAIPPKDEQKVKHVLSNIKQIAAEEIEKTIQIDTINDLAKFNKDEAIRRLAKITGNEEAAESLYEMLDKLSKAYKDASGDKSKNLVFSVIKDNQTNSNYIAITAKEYADKIASNQVLDKIDSNIALIEIGTIEKVKGINVFKRGGHRKIAGFHIDTPIKTIKSGSKTAKKMSIELVDSMTYAIRNAHQVAKLAAKAFAEGDFEYGARLINKKILKGIEDLPSVSFDMHGNIVGPNGMEVVNLFKVYTTKLKQFAGIINSDEYTNIAELTNLLESAVFQSKKGLNTDETINPRKLRSIIRDLILSDKNSKIYKKVDIYSEMTGFSLDDILDMMFLGHENDFSTKMSAYLMHPAAFSAGGIYTNVARPLLRQRISGQLITVNKPTNNLFYGSVITSTLNDVIERVASKNVGRQLTRGVTTKVLHISQEGLEDVINSYLESDEFKKLDKAAQDRIRKELRLLNIENQEMIISEELARAVSPTEFKEYSFSPTFKLNKTIHEKLLNRKVVGVKAGEEIGMIYNETTGKMEKVVASFTGTLAFTSDGKGVVLKKIKKTNYRSLKIGVGETEKSEAYILSNDVLNILRKATGVNFSVIMYAEQTKHKAIDSLIHNAVTKAYLDIKKQQMNDDAIDALKKDIFDILYPQELLELASQNKSGLRLNLSHGIDKQLTLDELQNKVISFSKERERFIIEPSDRIIAETEEAKKIVTEARAKALDRFMSKYNVKPDIEINAKNKKVKAYVSYENVTNLRDVDDILVKTKYMSELRKGVAFNTRVIESLYRTTDALGRPIIEPFVDELIDDALGNIPSKQLVKSSSKHKIRMIQEDIQVVAEYMAKYVYGDGNIQNARKINLHDLPYYKKGIEFEDISNMMKTKNLKLFGVHDRFVSIDLLTEVDIGGKKIKSIVLPNLALPAVGKNAFFTTEYQKAVKSFIQSDIKLREASKNVNTEEYNKALSEYKESISKIMHGIQQDLTDKEGMINSLLNFRLKYSGMGKAKQLPINDEYTAGISKAEDIIYISRKHAKRLLGEEYDKYAHLLDRDAAISYLQKQLGKTNITKEEIEKHWGMYGMIMRYPTIENLSVKAARVRVVDDSLLGGRQIGAFFHTLYGMGGDIDSDELGLVLLPKFDKMSKKAQYAFKMKYRAQINQNEIIKEILASERKTQLMSIYEALNGKTVEQLTKEEGSKINEILSGFRNVDDLISAFQNKASIGPANIGSYYIRRYAEIAAEYGVTKTFKDSARSRRTMSAIQALTYAAEQKMISYKHDASKNVGLMYLESVVKKDANEVTDMLMQTKKDIKDLFATHYAINVAQYDKNLARKILRGEVDIDKIYDETVDAIRASVELVKNKRIPNISINLGIGDITTLNDGSTALKLTKMSPVKKLAPTLSQFGVKVSEPKKQIYKLSRVAKEKLANNAKQTSESVKNSTGQAISASQTIKNILNSKIIKGAGLALGTMFVYGAVFNTDPAKSRAADDVGLIDDEEDNVQPVFTNNVPIVMNDNLKYGVQININATNKNGINHREIYDLIQNAFGTSVNVKMNINDNRKYDPFAVQEIVINSLNM